MSGFEKYPLPSHAAYTWVAGDHLWLGFPASSEETRGHSTKVPIDEAALRNLVADTDRCTLEERKTLASILGVLSVLRARSQAAVERGEAERRFSGVSGDKIGPLSAPPQTTLDEQVKSFRVTRIEPKAKQAALPTMTLADLDLSSALSPEAIRGLSK